MWALAIHGGAGLVTKHSLTVEREAACRMGLEAALQAGAAVLQAGGAALDACEAAVRCLEDDPLFNAGRGAVLAADGTAMLDASVMRGRDRAAGSVAAVRGVRHPVSLARAVMERSGHVLMVGEGAEAWARQIGAELAPHDWFVVPERQAQLERAVGLGRTALDHELDGSTGTVGAVARDLEGHLAAATSTGGLANKLPGRVGDSGMIGAGTWACDQTCAVSGTGHGEAFIRAHAASRTADLMELSGLDLRAACERTLDDVQDMGGSGGLVAVDRAGKIFMPFRTAGMYRATASATGPRVVDIW